MVATWNVINLDYAVSEGGETDVVNTVHWTCSDEDANGNTGNCYGSIVIPTDDLYNFTPYVDLTEEQTVQWAKDAIGPEGVTDIENNVAAQIAEKENPTEGSGVPW